MPIRNSPKKGIEDARGTAAVYHYLIVLNNGKPLIMLRTPMRRVERKRGGPRYKHEFHWKEIVRAALAALARHGLGKENLISLENAGSPTEWCPDVDELRTESERREAVAFRAKLELAYAGEKLLLCPWWLYEHGADGVTLLRKATEDANVAPPAPGTADAK